MVMTAKNIGKVRWGQLAGMMQDNVCFVCAKDERIWMQTEGDALIAKMAKKAPAAVILAKLRETAAFSRFKLNNLTLRARIPQHICEKLRHFLFKVNNLTSRAPKTV